MGVERQQGSGKQQDFFDEALKASLGHDVTGKGGTGAGTIEERQSPTAWAEPLALTRYVMEEVASSANLNQAYKRVKANTGAPGVDGMTVPDLRDWIAGNRERLIASLLDGTYRPSPCAELKFPNPAGKECASWAFRRLSTGWYNRRYCKSWIPSLIRHSRHRVLGSAPDAAHTMRCVRPGTMCGTAMRSS
nr:hypothetical protein [Novosphingobium decolorationis]